MSNCNYDGDDVPSATSIARHIMKLLDGPRGRTSWDPDFAINKTSKDGTTVVKIYLRGQLRGQQLQRQPVFEAHIDLNWEKDDSKIRVEHMDRAWLWAEQFMQVVPGAKSQPE